MNSKNRMLEVKIQIYSKKFFRKFLGQIETSRVDHQIPRSWFTKKTCLILFFTVSNTAKNAVDFENSRADTDFWLRPLNFSVST